MRADLQKKAAKEFAAYWKGRGYEKGESQKFWIDLLQSVYGVENATHYINFEDQVKLDHTSFIDGYIPDTKVMIEQKSIDKSLLTPIKQANGTYKTPFEQAKAYTIEMPYSKRPRWIVTCNFKEFLIYDMEKPQGEPESILLENLHEEYFRMDFLVKENAEILRKEMELSIEAGKIVGNLYDTLVKQYKNPDDKHSQHSLNVLCVRLVFCMYAEDSGLFGRHNMFHDHLSKYRNNPRTFRNELIELFKTLDTKYEDRDPYEEELNAFPYVNGGLFSDETIEIPMLDEDIIKIILEDGSEGFNWSDISPTIFGAVFESTLNPETRRKGGMHYTSIENIHKVIDPLFLDELKEELNEIKQLKQYKTIEKRAIDFQNKLASITCMDPAAGSGNFLTESYISLRKLENECIKLKNKYAEQQQLGFEGDENPIKVSIQQFYGIEINDFACTVAKTALWIAEHQMMKKTAEIVHTDLDFLPLKSYVNMTCGNALRMNWNNVVDKTKLSYIMGNPPFIGAMQSKGTKRDDIILAFPECEKTGQIDYVAGWYAKAAKYIKDTMIRCAFVSTNSICQGQQVALIWEPLFTEFDIKFDFAYHTFRWDSEANVKAHVHCIIIGFSNKKVLTKKKIYTGDKCMEVNHINGYLTDANDIFIKGDKKQISGMPLMHMGVMARDGGHLIMDENEYQEYVKKEPQGVQFIHSYMMGREFLNKIPRYCFWLLNADAAIIKKCPLLLKRIEKVKQARLASSANETRKLAETPSLFAQLNQPTNQFIAFPKVSSEKRKYIPIGFLDSDIIVGDKLYVVENVELYHFGVLISNVHNSWMRLVAGRLESRYSYSNTIVYNSFPWANPTLEQKTRIEQTAQEILDARAKYPDSSLSDMYGEYMYLYPELVKAHEANDKAVMKAYGFKPSMTEDEIVAELFKLYQKKVEEIGK